MTATITCVAILFVAPSALAQAEDAPVLREDFEAGREAWEPAGRGARDNAVSHGGDASMRIAD